MSRYKIIYFWIPLLLLLSAGETYAQSVTNGNYQTVAHITSDGTIQDSGYRTIGHITKDGTIQDASYRTIGHAKGIPLQWAAFYFFFKE